MSNLRPRDPARTDKSTASNIRGLPQQQIGAFGRPDDKGAQASSLMDRLTAESTLEIDRLISDLTKLRRRLEDEGNRVQRDVAEHSSFSQSVIQLTKIVSDSMAHVKGVSRSPTIDTETRIPTFLTALERQ